MFGYVVVNKPELKIKDCEVYSSFYCSLCQTLKRRFHRISQFTLNYDMVFLAILLTSLYEGEQAEYTYRCFIHPTQKKKLIQNEYLEYAADMTIVLTYLKCEDDVKDENSYKARVFQYALKKQYEKVYQRYPAKCDAIKNALRQSEALEKENNMDLDALSKCSGAFVAEIFSYRNDEWKASLHQLGDYLGRFIYLMDAYEDIKHDEKKGCFNPLKQYIQKEDFEDWYYTVLESIMAQSAQAFEFLPLISYIDILNNIMYAGVWTKYMEIKKKRDEQNER